MRLRSDLEGAGGKEGERSRAKVRFGEQRTSNRSERVSFRTNEYSNCTESHIRE